MGAGLRRRELALPAATLAGLAIGLALFAVDSRAADVAWAATAVLVAVPLTWSVVRSLARRDLGVDVIALVAIVAALAVGEYLAAAVVALMLAGGNALEAVAAGRARRELAALLARAPQVALRVTPDGVEQVPVDEVVVGDRVLVRTGEVLPVDGVVEGETATIDGSALTGEALPVLVPRGGPVRSGTTNAGAPMELRATRPARESAYAALLRLVREAESQRAPFVRMADRYAALFLPATLLLAGAAWALSGDPVRAVAVLVVATPCPLILAAPVALVAGVSRAAKRGVIVKGAGVIEALGGTRTVVLDKTGTLTLGTPRVDEIVPVDGVAAGEVLRLAGSLEQLSSHVLAEAVVRDARERGALLSFPEHAEEEPGRGIEGIVDGRRVAVGSGPWIAGRGYGAAAPGPAREGRATVVVGVDGSIAGTILMGDVIRPDARDLIARLRRAGVREIALATGDQPAVAEEVARRVGVDRVYAQQSPEDKLALVTTLRARSGEGTVVMVGDGVNDAPALAGADVGIAVGGARATASSQAADAVIVDDRIERVAEAIEIGRRSLRIARQSVLAGMGLSGVAMVFAAAGLIPPLAGALLQEGIDIAVILNALRAVRG
jgi:heavy metal translocating P-type ATPase